MKTKTISEQITEALIEKKTTIKDLANSTGFDYMFINGVLQNSTHGSTIQLHQLEQIAAALEMEIQLVPVGKTLETTCKDKIGTICDCIPPINERDKEVNMYQIALNHSGVVTNYIATEQLMKINAVYNKKKGKFSLDDSTKLRIEGENKIEEYKTKYPLQCKSTK